MAAQVTSTDRHVCSACLGPIAAGLPHVFCAATGDRYHPGCWAALEDSPGEALAPANATPAKEARRPGRPPARTAKKLRPVTA